MQWYVDNNVRRLDWPAQSPDLNSARPKSIAQLMEWLQEEWRRIPVDALQTLVESMPDRVAAVIAARADEGETRSVWSNAGMGGVGETGDPGEDPLTSRIVRHDSHMRKSGELLQPGIEPGSPWEYLDLLQLVVPRGLGHASQPEESFPGLAPLAPPQQLVGRVRGYRQRHVAGPGTHNVLVQEAGRGHELRHGAQRPTYIHLHAITRKMKMELGDQIWLYRKLFGTTGDIQRLIRRPGQREVRRGARRRQDASQWPPSLEGPREVCTVNCRCRYIEETQPSATRINVNWFQTGRVADLQSEGRGFTPRCLRRGGCSARLSHWEFVNKSVSLELRQRYLSDATISNGYSLAQGTSQMRPSVTVAASHRVPLRWYLSDATISNGYSLAQGTSQMRPSVTVAASHRVPLRCDHQWSSVPSEVSVDADLGYFADVGGADGEGDAVGDAEHEPGEVEDPGGARRGHGGPAHDVEACRQLDGQLVAQVRRHDASRHGTEDGAQRQQAADPRQLRLRQLDVVALTEQRQRRRCPAQRAASAHVRQARCRWAGREVGEQIGMQIGILLDRQVDRQASRYVGRQIGWQEFRQRESPSLSWAGSEAHTGSSSITTLPTPGGRTRANQHEGTSKRVAGNTVLLLPSLSIHLREVAIASAFLVVRGLHSGGYGFETWFSHPEIRFEWFSRNNSGRGATVAEQLACSPLTKAIRVQYGFSHVGNCVGRRCWSAGFLGDLQFHPPLSFRCCSILTSIALIGSQDLDTMANHFHVLFLFEKRSNGLDIDETLENCFGYGDVCTFHDVSLSHHQPNKGITPYLITEIDGADIDTHVAVCTVV
ncbi:hypothetical protein PR048_031112 [Dryococelus australis]|uniref:Uncharacterized protein n=1 Tax=Dryococelus australis TaxID=614101 RepID=A0ABQ9G757_9NEOP|nr:hypothetical protein PR048_031112 [Dryococelus australis]